MSKAEEQRLATWHRVREAMERALAEGKILHIAAAEIPGKRGYPTIPRISGTVGPYVTADGRKGFALFTYGGREPVSETFDVAAGAVRRTARMVGIDRTDALQAALVKAYADEIEAAQDARAKTAADRRHVDACISQGARAKKADRTHLFTFFPNPYTR